MNISNRHATRHIKLNITCFVSNTSSFKWIQAHTPSCLYYNNKLKITIYIHRLHGIVRTDLKICICSLLSPHLCWKNPYPPLALNDVLHVGFWFVNWFHFFSGLHFLGLSYLDEFIWRIYIAIDKFIQVYVKFKKSIWYLYSLLVCKSQYVQVRPGVSWNYLYQTKLSGVYILWFTFVSTFLKN